MLTGVMHVPSAYNYVVPARGKELVKTDLSIALPDGKWTIFTITDNLFYLLLVFVGVYGRVAPRSGLAWKNSIDVGAGVIDQDYRGVFFMLCRAM